MEALSLREELLALAGVAEADVEGDEGAPAGVRIRLAPAADEAAVGAEVQRVLAQRGMRSRVGVGEETGVPGAPVAPEAVGPSAGAAPEPARAGGTAAGRALHSVLLEESASGLQVTVVTADGRRSARSAEVGEEELVSAVIGAVGIALDGSEPRVLAVQWATVGESRVVTLVLEGIDGRRGAGAGLVRASRAYAVARAAWSALID